MSLLIWADSILSVFCNWQNLFPSRYFLPQSLGEGKTTCKPVQAHTFWWQRVKQLKQRANGGEVWLDNPWGIPKCWLWWWGISAKRTRGWKRTFFCLSVSADIFPRGAPFLLSTPSLPWPLLSQLTLYIQTLGHSGLTHSKTLPSLVPPDHCRVSSNAVVLPSATQLKLHLCCSTPH